MPDASLWSATQAAEELGVTLPTLYTYVSRGLIRSRPGPQNSRNRVYEREEVLGLKQRSGKRRTARLRPRSSMPGDPALNVRTPPEVAPLHYVGRNLLRTVADSSIEHVAGLLWSGNTEAGSTLFSAPLASTQARLTTLRRLVSDLPNVEMFQILLSLAAADDPGAYDLRPHSVALRGAQIMKLMILAITGRVPEAGVAAALQHYWAPSNQSFEGLLDRAMVVCADFTVSPSILAVRCVASGRSTPYATTIAGLSTLLGLRRGTQHARVEAFVDEVGSPERARSVLANRLKRGEELFGFANNGYLSGDPRGKALVQLARKEFADSLPVALGAAIEDAAMSLIGEPPNLDFGLVTLTRAMGLPRGSALTIAALGHTVVWIADAIDEYAQDRLLLPPV